MKKVRRMKSLENAKDALYAFCTMTVVAASTVGLVVVIAALAIGAVKNCAG